MVPQILNSMDVHIDKNAFVGYNIQKTPIIMNHHYMATMALLQAVLSCQNGVLLYSCMIVQAKIVKK